MTRLLNFITFQVWALFTAVGVVVSVLTWSTTPAAIAPWIGLVVGVLANELTEGYHTAGIEIVSEQDNRQRIIDNDRVER